MSTTTLASARSETARAAAPEEPPRPAAPIWDALVDGASVTLTWDAVPGATSYRVQVARNGGFADDLWLDTRVGPSRSVTVYETFPTDGTRFFWRVAALGADGAGPFSEPALFRTGTDDDVLREQEADEAHRRGRARRHAAPGAAASDDDTTRGPIEAAAPHLTGVTSTGDTVVFILLILATTALLLAIGFLLPVGPFEAVAP